LVLAGLVCAIAAVEPPTSDVLATTCMPMDEFATALLARFQALVTSTDSIKVAARQRMQLGTPSVEQVSYVTSNATCNSVAVAYNAAVTRTPPATPSPAIYVWQVGSDFVALDTAQRSGEWTLGMTLTNKFVVVTRYVF
jgi:hypothetical protein